MTDETTDQALNDLVVEYKELAGRVGRSFGRKHGHDEDEAHAEAWYILTVYLKEENPHWPHHPGEAASDRFIGVLVCRGLRTYFAPHDRARVSSDGYPEEDLASQTHDAPEMLEKWGEDGFEVYRKYLDGHPELDKDYLEEHKPDVYKAMLKTWKIMTRRTNGTA